MDKQLEIQSYNAQLRRVLRVLFPSSYIKLYHQSGNSVCTLMELKCGQSEEEQRNNKRYQEQPAEVSTEPSSRTSVTSLREHLNSSLLEHQAKSMGLCPIRRIIYDQCFDELIRQVTVNCIERGLLLFRIRNELRMTINYYRKIYESGVEFGLRKATEAEIELDKSRSEIKQLTSYIEELKGENLLKCRMIDVELQNKLDSFDRVVEHYKSQIEERDKIIERQRATIRTLSQKTLNDIKSPV